MNALSKYGVSFVNASGVPNTLRIFGSRIASIGEHPEPGDVIIDVRGDRLLPGLINAHDHLQLNGLPRVKYRAQYEDVSEWIDDVNAHLASDEFKRNLENELDARLVQGGLKNLLSGVTTVAHHDPTYDALRAPSFPVRIVPKYGWSHSLGIDGADAVAHSYASTPKSRPWIIHAAEGVGPSAASEFAQLETLGCIAQNTLLVHGIALTHVQQLKLLDAQAALIWCPSSNLYLFGRTADVEYLALRGRVALGSDSRMSGERDLLEEIRVARQVSGFDEPTLEALVTKFAARLLRLNDRGHLTVGARADLLLMPRDVPLSHGARADVRLVYVGGYPRYADPVYALQLAPRRNWVEIAVDGRRKFLHRSIADQIRAMNICEPGFEPLDAAWRAA